MTSSSPECVQVTTTASTPDEARAIADAVLEPRLAACVQIVGPIESRYWWEGALEAAEEWLVLVKTTAACVDGVSAAIRELHSYDVPEVIAVPIVGGGAAYLEWVGETVRPPD